MNQGFFVPEKKRAQTDRLTRFIFYKFRYANYNISEAASHAAHFSLACFKDIIFSVILFLSHFDFL